MRDILSDLETWLENGEEIALGTVVSTWGSSPRPVASKLAVTRRGGIAGSVRLEDIAEELFGETDAARDAEPIQQLGPFRYRLSGDIAIHDWADVFGIDLEETRFSTIGGLVTALLGKIPRKGDVATLGSLKFTVERVRKRRVEAVVMSLEPLSSNE